MQEGLVRNIEAFSRFLLTFDFPGFLHYSTGKELWQDHE